MNKSIFDSDLLNRVESRLQRIGNILLINASFIENPGLLNGKTGISVFFYEYGRYLKNKIYTDYAGELIDEIYEEIAINTPLNFASGLTGIGWGIEYLVKNKFVDADTDEVLADIDNAVNRGILNNPLLLENENDLFGYGHYCLSRLRGHENDNDNLSSLIKKEHLIYLIDECERLLVHKRNHLLNSIDTSYVAVWEHWAIVMPDQLKNAVESLKYSNAILSIPYSERIYKCDQLSGGLFGKSMKPEVFNLMAPALPVEGGDWSGRCDIMCDYGYFNAPASASDCYTAELICEGMWDGCTCECFCT